MPSPMTAVKDLLTQLGEGGTPSADMATRVELIVNLLRQHSADDLIRVAELLDSTSKTRDRAVAFAAAGAEVAKLPVKEAVEAEAATRD